MSTSISNFYHNRNFFYYFYTRKIYFIINIKFIQQKYLNNVKFGINDTETKNNCKEKLFLLLNWINKENFPIKWRKNLETFNVTKKWFWKM